MIVDLNNLMHAEALITHVHLIADVPPDRYCIGRYRVVMSRLFSSVKAADPKSVIISHKAVREQLSSKIHYSCNICIDQLNKFPSSIRQVLKYFLKGKPK